MDDPADSDGALVEGLRRGDAEATRLVWERFGAHIEQAIARRWPASLEQKEPAEGVALSAFRTFVRRMREGQFECESAARVFPLLLGIALRKAARKARRLLAGRRDVRREVPLDLDTAEPVGRSPNPCDLVEAADLIEALWEAVAALRDSERQAVELMLRGQSTHDIAAALGCSAEWARHLLRAARENLKRALKEG